MDSISSSERIAFDFEKKKFFIHKQTLFRDLPLTEGDSQPCPLSEILRQLPEVIFENWDYVKKENKTLASFFERWNYFYKASQKADLPLFEGNFLKTIIEQTCLGEKDFNVLLEKDWTYFLLASLNSENKKDFESCPEKVQVPSGSWIPVSYPNEGEEKPPFIAVRLQEVFGWIKTPQIGPQKVPIVIHLLAPNYRPVQVTQDLESSWASGYNEVRKTLKIKYPKHSWPENPLTAAAVAKGRPK